MIRVKSSYLDCVQKDRDNVPWDNCFPVGLALVRAAVPELSVIEGPSVIAVAESL